MNAPASANKTFPRPLRGIIPPMITPLRAQDELDVAGLERLAAHILAGGVHGLFILGTSGEGPSLSYRLRRELIERCCRIVAGRLPVLVGITDTSFTESVHLARHAADTGASAVVLSTPYYFPVSQPELVEYLEDIVPELPLPLLLYNMPSMTKVQFEPETVRRAMDLAGIIGLKDSSGDLNYFGKIVELARGRPDWTVLLGPEEMLAESMALGGHGGVSGGANVYPRLFVELFEAVSRNDAEGAARLQSQVMTLSQIYRVGRHASACVKGMKCAASLLGICEDRMAEPFSKFREPERARVRATLCELGLLSSAV